MILQLQAKVHGLGNLGVSTCTYPNLNDFEAIFLINIFNYKGFFFKIEVERDFFGGLSKRVTLKFSWQPSNFIEFRIPYDFAIAS